MILHDNTIFHIYNQGNNRRDIFYSEENYQYFLWKMKSYLLPFGDLIGYCLMPNHFHWLFRIESVNIKRDVFRKHVNKIEMERRIKKYGSMATRVNKENRNQNSEKEWIDLNESIGILQKTYTRAFNKENDLSGSLFRSNCKAKDGWIDEFVVVEKWKGTSFLLNSDYIYQCLHYIHNNPVKAGLVDNNVDWKYSSAQDYMGKRKESICNIEMGKDIMNFL